MLIFFFETFRMAVNNLRLHKLRSLLTAVGIIFGVMAVIIMVAIGEGTKKDALQQLEQLGATNIVVRSKPPPESNQASSRAQRTLVYGLKETDLTQIRALPNITRVIPLRNTEQRVIRGDVRAEANAVGTTPDWFEAINLKLDRGLFFTWKQYEEQESVAVIGAHVAKQLFPHTDAIGQPLQIGQSGMNTAVVTIIGVLEPTGLRAGGDQAGVVDRDLDSDVYFPLTLAKARFGDTVLKRQAGTFERKQIELTEIWLQAHSINDVERVSRIAENVVGLPARRDVQVKAPIQILRAAERTQRMFNFIMVGIASFALIVGGIGIMNIMLASVTERTREIGIRRALGAKRRHITLQFLIETTVISLTGGSIGVALGAGMAYHLPQIIGWFSDQTYPTVIALWSVIGSFVVSGLIGIGFGLYPAMTAARMNPIEALRHE
jgi:putative ABC transport system permease protein